MANDLAHTPEAWSAAGPIRAGLLLLAATVGGGGYWATQTTIATAVVAPAETRLAGDIKLVQHPQGGVLAELLVKNGDVVKAGQVVARLDPTRNQASVGATTSEISELLARRARLAAERDGAAAMGFPEADNKEAGEGFPALVRAQQAEFDSRRQSFDSQTEQLRQQIAALRQQMAGSEAQLTGTRRQMDTLRPDLEKRRDLSAQGLFPLMQLNQMQRSLDELVAREGELSAAVAQSRERIGEVERRLGELAADRRSKALGELRDVETRLKRLREERVAAEYDLKRVDIKAPVEGRVQELSIHTVGGVVPPREPLMKIAPLEGEIIIEARVEPLRRDEVWPGQEATIRFSALNRVLTPEVKGTVASVYDDRAVDPSGRIAYFLAEIHIPPEEQARIDKKLLLRGLPAEAHLRTGDRTPWSYLVKPLTDSWAKSFKAW